MADCDAPTLSVPEATCVDDLPTLFNQLVSEVQSAINHLVGCIVDFQYPQCDICVLKDDLVNCPLDCNMIDFSNIAWGDSGDVCQLPYPPQVTGLEFRYGSDTITGVNNGDWTHKTIVFSSPFPNSCLGVIVQAREYTSGGGAYNLYKTYTPIVRDVTGSQFVVWVMMDEDPGAWPGRDLQIYYFAWGN